MCQRTHEADHRYLTSRNGIGNRSGAPVGNSTFGAARVETLLVGIFGAKVGGISPRRQDQERMKVFLASFD